jgi:hypothetical protein
LNKNMKNRNTYLKMLTNLPVNLLGSPLIIQRS